MLKFSLTNLLLLLLLFLLLCSNLDCGHARSGRHWKSRKPPAAAAMLAKKKGKGKSGGGGGGKHHNAGSYMSSPSAPVPSPSPMPGPVIGYNSPSPAPSPAPAPSPQLQASSYNVIDFGAKGDGLCDDTKAFQAAWASACNVEASTLLVPAGYEFLLGPISFTGPYCKPNIIFQLDGTIILLTSPKAWDRETLQWIEFTKLVGITIQGDGIIEGRGNMWWINYKFDGNPVSSELHKKMPTIKPTALRFYGSLNVTVTGITIQNSPQCHLKFDTCESVEVSNINISSPGDSLNTDGIHLQNSIGVAIHDADLACGDDCISIQTGCSNIYVHNVNCGPGHGISIGGLGRDNTKACVSNITVRDVNMHDTMNGVRIKTWQGGSGSVQGIIFTNIQVSAVQMPIVIDQFYCDQRACSNQSSAVALSAITYENIRGTFTVKPMHFACSDSFPCADISLIEVELEPLQEQYQMYDPFCWQAFGELFTPIVPPIYCLQGGKPTSNRIMSDQDSC